VIYVDAAHVDLALELQNRDLPVKFDVDPFLPLLDMPSAICTEPLSM